MILAVTGHRPPKVGGYNVPNPVMQSIGNAIRADFRRLEPLRVLTGMALGVDQWVAWICLEMNIPFTAVLPCRDFSSRWPERSRAEFRHLMDRARDTILVSNDMYTSGCLMQRNRWLVDNSDALYAVWNGIPEGGTYSTIRYATRVGRRVENASISMETWEQARVIEGRAAPSQQELIPRHSNVEAMQRSQRDITQLEELARRNFEEFSRRAQLQAEEPFRRQFSRNRRLPEEPPAPRANRRDFEDREYLNLYNTFDEAVVQALQVPSEMIAPTPPSPVRKQATINTEDRTTPKRFVDIGEDD